MSLSKIRSALVEAFIGTALFEAKNVAFENMSFTPGKVPWAKFSYIPNDPFVFTLGKGGSDKVTGFIQIDLNYPPNKGTKEIDACADSLRNTFTAGKVFTYSEQQVTISNCGRSQGRIVDGFYRVSVTVYFYAYITRPI